LAIVFEHEGRTWSAYDPDVPGVFGTGSTREAALADWAEAKAVLVDYEAGKVDEAAEDAQDVLLVEARLADIEAGKSHLVPLEEAMRQRGLDFSEDDEAAEDAEDVRLADEARAEILAGARVYTHEEVVKMLGLDDEKLAPLASSARVGIISDIHGDVFSLDQALARLRAMGVDLILCAGDLLDVEPFGEETCQRLKAEGVVTIRGNHERWALERRRRRPDPRLASQGCDLGEPADLFGGGAELSRPALAWLRALPDHWTAELAGFQVSMWHARPGSDMRGVEADKTGPKLRRELLDRAGADILIVGHTHESFALVEGEGLIVNPGSCCSKIPAKSGEGYRPATFGVLELPAKRFSVHQVLA
jgi:predicted phosphodiesterase/predicted RNase H-like HicB family nuclease